MLGKFVVSPGFSFIYISTTELYPTQVSLYPLIKAVMAIAIKTLVSIQLFFKINLINFGFKRFS